ncbi:MAG TPA: hypothetical protein VFB33_15815 [Candidatus Binataceae bacterium]|nr:hypothetical protein [Candidatus Binataceae bacterium]
MPSLSRDAWCAGSVDLRCASVARSMILVAAIGIALVLSWRGESFAYIDPNAGGFLSQILAPLVAVFLSFVFYCRKELRRRLKSVRDRLKGHRAREAAREAGK